MKKIKILSGIISLILISSLCSCKDEENITYDPKLNGATWVHTYPSAIDSKWFGEAFIFNNNNFEFFLTQYDTWNLVPMYKGTYTINGDKIIFNTTHIHTNYKDSPIFPTYNISKNQWALLDNISNKNTYMTITDFMSELCVQKPEFLNTSIFSFNKVERPYIEDFTPLNGLCFRLSYSGNTHHIFLTKLAFPYDPSSPRTDYKTYEPR